LIEYDSSRSFAHASYYVQKVFAGNRPDVNLVTAAELEPKPDPNQPLLGGKFGLGAWNTQTEFKELRVYDEQDKLVYSDDFKTLENWETPGIGTWRVENGVLQQTEDGQSPAMLFLKPFKLEKGRVTLKARRVGGAEGFLMLFNASGPDRFLFCNYGAAGNAFSAIQDRGVPDGCAFKGGRSRRGKIENERWYDISLVVKKDEAQMLLDGNVISTARVEWLSQFFATAGYDRKNQSVIVKATSYSSKPVRAEIQLDGAAKVGASGKHIIISSPAQYDENSLDHPRRIQPKELPLSDASKRFSVELPPYSVNVLRIPATAK
ncbi:MAG: hypothetical protein NT154_27935, partial [Verrucomicrobia bacterium]|nr:hypothetical protein [Verrucomicrobiota bacterium]